MQEGARRIQLYYASVPGEEFTWELNGIKTFMMNLVRGDGQVPTGKVREYGFSGLVPLPYRTT